MSAKPIIAIVSPWLFQGQLVEHLLQAEGMTCELIRHDCRRLVGVFRACAESKVQPSLILIDIGTVGYPLDSRGVFAATKPARCPVALMNLEPGTGVEKQALTAGYRGFFYRTDALELFVRGVRSMLGGVVWVSRSVLAQCLTGNGYADGEDKTSKPNLSPREIEVLALVATGATNEEVADMLSVSPSTVKTHLYSIFKKLELPSRLQAALWAAKNL